MQAIVERVRALSQPMEPMPTEVEPRVATVEGLRAVVFDVYGTMIISGSGDVGVARASYNQRALEMALQTAGYVGDYAAAARRGHQLFVDEIAATHLRLREQGTAYPEVEIRTIWRAVLSRLQAEGLLDVAGPGDPTERVMQLAVHYECRTNPAWPMPGLLEVLDVMLARGLRLGIVSNAQFFTPYVLEALTRKSVEALGFTHELCVWSFALLEAKPSVRLYDKLLEGLERQGIGPEQVLYIGNDMLNDIWPASRVGLRTALFAGDERSLRLRADDTRCAGVQPDLVITHLRQLIGAVRPG